MASTSSTDMLTGVEDVAIKLTLFSAILVATVLVSFGNGWRDKWSAGLVVSKKVKTTTEFGGHEALCALKKHDCVKARMEYN